MLYDVIVIGGSFAGQSAAMQLVRARRRVALVDAGRPRNRFAATAHGFLGQDGVPPSQIMARARAQLTAYPTLEWIEGSAEIATGGRGRFTVALGDGRTLTGRRLILATGVRDELPPLPGLAERWGHSVLHCPYCHGYEMGGRPMGVLATQAGADMKALLIADWGPSVLFTQDALLVAPDMAARLAARGVTTVTEPVVELLGPAPALEAARLRDGSIVPVAALFVGPRTHMASTLAAQLGCAFIEGHSGPHLSVDDWGLTSVPGVYAAGDAIMAMHNATLAAASGVRAGAGTHQSMLMD